jgi:hypothetical protein
MFDLRLKQRVSVHHSICLAPEPPRLLPYVYDVSVTLAERGRGARLTIVLCLVSRLWTRWVISVFITLCLGIDRNLRSFLCSRRRECSSCLIRVQSSALARDSQFAWRFRSCHMWWFSEEQPHSFGEQWHHLCPRDNGLEFFFFPCYSHVNCTVDGFHQSFHARNGNVF